jgi:hypothetical protein
VYEKEELDKFCVACAADERLWFEFFLMTGMREQEVMFVYWKDIKFADSIVRVTHKLDRGWDAEGVQRTRNSSTGHADAVLEEITCKV